MIVDEYPPSRNISKNKKVCPLCMGTIPPITTTIASTLKLRHQGFMINYITYIKNSCDCV
jgi:hypothetical protein